MVRQAWRYKPVTIALTQEVETEDPTCDLSETQKKETTSVFCSGHKGTLSLMEKMFLTLM